jgi:hypothetical protein
MVSVIAVVVGVVVFSTLLVLLLLAPAEVNPFSLAAALPPASSSTLLGL